MAFPSRSLCPVDIRECPEMGCHGNGYDGLFLTCWTQGQFCPSKTLKLTFSSIYLDLIIVQVQIWMYGLTMGMFPENSTFVVNMVLLRLL